MTTKHWVSWGAAGAVAMAAILLAVVLLPASEGPDLGEEEAAEPLTFSDHAALQALLAEQGMDVHVDSDGDGLADVVENFLYGSDPHAFSTTGNGVPDGWFAQYGYDPTIAGVESRPAAVPPADGLPDVYGGYWPDEYRWTLGAVYAHGMPETENDTYWDNGIDPRKWAATDDGVPTAWLAYHFAADAHDITDPALADQSLTADAFTVRDNYEHDTDPSQADTDGDALTDADEVRRYDTDPRRFSTTGSGVPDGWLVGHELDPLDAHVASLDPAGKGMTVADVWEYNEDRFGLADALGGDGLDPTQMSHRDDAVPDGWLLENGLDPMEPDVASQQSQCASDYDDVKHLDSDVPEGLDAIPDLCLTVEQAYVHGRPDAWSEADSGPWPGGLDPASGDQDGDGLPDAVEIRGWYVQRVVGVGPTAKGEWIRVTSDPLGEDRDGDGLTDHEEYHGEAVRDAATYRFSPTDPSNPDTAFSGLTDAEKVFAEFGGTSWDLHEETDGALHPLLDPTRRDSAGDHLADGDAVAFWMQASQNVLDDVPYDDVYPGSGYASYLDWINRLPWLVAEGRQLSTQEAAELLGPDGDADGDGEKNVIDPSAGGDGLLNGWQVRPQTLRFSDFPSTNPRAATDPANPDTDKDGLPDWWELTHGEWDESIGNWDLDPARADSDGDGTSDDEENLDGDVVLWHAYLDGVATPDEWPFTNLLEFQAGTDPRVTDQTQNGVSEGWVVFWASGLFYDRWVQEAEQGDEEMQRLVGDRVPTTEQITAIRDGPDGIANPLDPDVGRRVKDEVDYFRFIIEPDPAADAFHLDEEFDERFVEGWPTEVTVLRENGETTVRLGIIEGAYAHTYADDQTWGLNPYLDDTPGDGLRDAWTAFFAAQCGAGLDPAHVSALSDPDLDGLTNLQEYRRGLSQAGDLSTNPCVADTDLDGMKDGEEVLLNLEPLDPTDAALGGGELDDADGDGVPDPQEVIAGMDPSDPDSDRDGLADGTNRPPRQNFEWLTEWTQEYQAMGVAHRDTRCIQGDTGYDSRGCFFGEGSNQGDPERADSIIRDIPDGWTIYWHQTKDGASPDLATRYACGMPSWWDQSSFGVWWWGMPPVGPGECPRDRDRDGLDDANGEDPVPAASQTNEQAATDVQGLLEADGVASRDLVVAAQAWGECAGHPEPCLDDWTDNAPPPRVPVTVEDLQFQALDGSELGKEEEFTVTGRLLVDCSNLACADDTAAPYRTVVVRLAGADPLAYDVLSDDFHQHGATLGVGFTDETGAFSVTACLCGQGDTIAVDEGMVALGRSNTTAAWTPPAAAIPVDSQWTLGVHAYAGTTAFWGTEGPDDTHPQYLEIGGQPRGTHSQWAAADQPVQVVSATTLSVEAPLNVAWSDDTRSLPVEVSLRDASGGAVPQQHVTVTIDGLEPRTEPTDLDGDLRIDIPLGSVTGPIEITAHFAGAAGWSDSTDSFADTRLQAPLTVQATTESTVVRLGEPIEIDATATSQQTPVAGVNVTVTLGGVSQTRTTDDDGHVRVSLTPTDLPPGANQITVRASSTNNHTAAAADLPISLVTGSTLQPVIAEDGTLDAPLPVSGHLTLTDGTPLAGEKILVTVDGTPLADFTTNAAGRFHGAIDIPLEIGIGLHTFQFAYAGEPDAIDAATAERTVRFSVGTVLALDPADAGRGQGVVLTGRLTTVTGQPLVGEHLRLTMPWTFTTTTLVRSGGSFSVNLSVPSSHALGPFPFNATYGGSLNGTYGASKAAATLTIQAPSRLEADPLGLLNRGNNTVTGRLVDALTTAPIADAVVHATASHGDPATVRTDADGRYQFNLALPSAIPAGPVNVSVRFDGDAGYAPAENETAGILRVPARLTLSAPGELGRGTGHPIGILLTDDRNEPLAGRNVSLSVLGTQSNATTDENGQATHTVDVPSETELGPTRLLARFDGDAGHDAAQASRDATVKDGVQLTVDGVPETVRPGQQVSLRVHVEDTAGRPVETTVLVTIQGVPGSIVVETDDAGDATITVQVPDDSDGALHLTVRFPGTDLLASRSLTMEPTITPLAQDTVPEATTPWRLVAAVAAAVLLLTAGVVVYLVRRQRDDDIVRILKTAQERIAAGGPWAAAVLLAYWRLSDHVRAYGIVEEKSDTARAFAQALTNAGVLDPETAVHLVGLFERARYAGEDMGIEEASEARRILRASIRSAERLASRAGGPAA